MAENTRLKDLQNQVTTQGEELRGLMTLIELWDQAQHDRDIAQQQVATRLQNTTQERLEQMQKAINLLVHNHSQPLGVTNSPRDSSLPMKNISLGFPHFDGTTPILEWIFKAEKFFSYHNTLDATRVDIAAIHFEKDVVPWFQMLQRLNAIRSWSELTTALESQFGPSFFDCPAQELFKLQQSGTVSDYYVRFMALANRSFGLSTEALL